MNDLQKIMAQLDRIEEHLRCLRWGDGTTYSSQMARTQGSGATSWLGQGQAPQSQWSEAQAAAEAARQAKLSPASPGDPRGRCA
jgi:hypothetical protein